MPTTSADVCKYRRNGYLLLKGFFQKSEVGEVRAEAKHIFEKQMHRKGYIGGAEISELEFEQALFGFFKSDLPTFINCANQAHYVLSLHRLGADQRIHALLKYCGLSSPTLSKFPTIYFNSRHLAKQEHYWRQREHQDWRILQGSLDSAVLWVALVDIDRSLGALEVLPRSHTRGLLNSDVDEGYGKIHMSLLEESAFVPMEMEAGDALLFSTFLVHRSGINSTESLRWSVHYRYSNLDEPTFIERRYPQPFAYKPDVQLITEGFPEPGQLEAIYG